jgi:hypothetical protein
MLRPPLVLVCSRTVSEDVALPPRPSNGRGYGAPTCAAPLREGSLLLMRPLLGWLLIALAGFMFIGYLGADVDGSGALIALLITVLLPAAGGVAVLTGRVRVGAAAGARKLELRQQTLKSELLRIAGAHGGRLTVLEAVKELAVTPEEAKQSLPSDRRRIGPGFQISPGLIQPCLRQITDARFGSATRPGPGQTRAGCDGR